MPARKIIAEKIPQKIPFPPFPGDPVPDIFHQHLIIEDYKKYVDLEIGLRQKQLQIEIERLALVKDTVKKFRK